MSAVKNSIGNFITKIALYPIGFISSVIVARLLGPEDRGIYTYLLLLASFLLPILTFGFGNGITYYISSKENKPEKILFTVFVSAIFFGLLISLFIYVTWLFELLGATGKKVVLVDLLFLLGSIFFNTIFFFLTRVLTGDSKFNSINWITIIQGFTNPIILLILVWVMNLGLHGAAISIFLVNLFVSSITIFYVFKMYILNFEMNLSFIKKCFSYGLKGWLGDMAVRANLRLDQILLGATVSAASLGIYSVAVMLVELIWIIPDAIGPVLFNKIAAETDIEERIKLTNKLNRLLIGLSFFIGVILLLAAYFIIIPYGFGDAYNGAMIPLMLMVPGSMFFIVAKVITKILSGSGRIGATSKAMIVGSTASIFFYIILIPIFGINGAALASSLGYVCVSLACMYQYNKYFDIKISNLFVITISDIYWLKTISAPFMAKLKSHI